jgi:hypothetical protein
MMLVFWSLEFWVPEGSVGGFAPLLAAYGGGRAIFFVLCLLACKNPHLGVLSPRFI